MEAKNQLKAPAVDTFLERMPAPWIDNGGSAFGSDAVRYAGYSCTGVAEDEEGWRIVKYTDMMGTTVTKAEYPDGSMDFKFKWSERANYTYSR